MISKIVTIAAMTAGIGSAAMAQETGREAERAMLKNAVEIPTVKGRGQMDEMAAFLGAELRKAGIRDIVIKKHGDTETVIARWKADAATKRPMLLMAHMDVVEANAADWKNPPFEFREQKDWYLGRGVRDNKAGMVAMIAALQRLKAAGFKPSRDIVILLTGDEETKQDGARLATTEWKPLVDAEFALNSDGGGAGMTPDGNIDSFGLQVAEKIYGDFSFVAVNRGGHSSAPRADNAIYQLAGALKNLEEFRFTPHLDALTRPGWEYDAKEDGGTFGAMVQAWLDDPTNMELADAVEAVAPGSTRTRCVATQLSAGHAPNALPQRAEANVNCRIFPGETFAETQAALQRLAGPDVTVTRVEDGGLASPPSPLRADVVAAMNRSVQARWPKAVVLPSMSAGATDGSYTRAAGIPTYGVSTLWSPIGQPSGVHGLDERVPAKAFHEEVDHWERLLRDLAG